MGNKIEYSNNENNIVLTVSEDNLEAYLEIRSCPDFLNEKDIVDLIDRSGIKFGIEAAKEYLQNKDYLKKFDEPFLIAKGEKFKEASVEFDVLFPLENNYSPEHPITGLQNLVKVCANEPLAHLFITRDEVPGKDIFGNLMNSGLSPDDVINNYLGENVYYSEERSQIFSETIGYPYLEENKIHVKSDFELEGNVDINYQNFTLYGNLKVNGNITDKIQINVKGNLEVNGELNDVDLIVGGNAKINGDIINSSVSAQGNLTIDTAEDSTIISAQKIILKNHCHFCKIIAEKGLAGDNSTSTIVGGITLSGDNIELAVAGNSSYLNTEIEISISPYLKENMLKLNKELIRLTDSSNPDKERIKTLEDELHILESKFEEKLNQALFSEEDVPKHITVYKKIFGGTYLRILKKAVTVTEDQERVSFSVVNGDLITDSF